MKTISEYREEISRLMKKAGDIDAACIAGNRDPSEEEVLLKGDILNGIEDLKKIVETQERQERIKESLSAPPAPETRPQPTKGVSIGEDRKSKDTFTTFGEQMIAVMRAGLPGGNCDPRLLNTRATGMSESVPSDGGLA
jgi:hypothetical protein